MADKLYIVMPAYNESANIESVISEWHPVCEKIVSDGDLASLVIANDGSKDDTYHKMTDLQDKYPLLMPIDKPNSGHGATVLFLYRKAIDDGVTFVFQTDSDGQTRPDEFWQMWENRHKFDFQIGTRGGRKDGFSRIVVTRVLRMVVFLMFHCWVKDANTPFRLMKVSRLNEIMKLIPEDFFLANVAISAAIVKRRESLAWYPITFRPRQGGVNSINLRRIMKIGMKSIGEFRQINKNIK